MKEKKEKVAAEDISRQDFGGGCSSQTENLDHIYHTREKKELEERRMAKIQEIEEIIITFKGGVENLSVPFTHQHHLFLSLHFLFK